MTETTTTETLYKLAEAATLKPAKAREILDELNEVRDAAEAIQELGLPDLVDQLNQALDSLQILTDAGLVFDEDKMQALVGLVSDLVDTVPDDEGLQSLVDAYDEALTAIETVEEQKDAARGEYTADDKREARDDAQEKLKDLADALDLMAPATTDNTDTDTETE